jgi:peptidoglycan/LPS O-acetylase OafA/YrhL
MGSPATTRNGFVDSLRFFAALGIVLFHMEMPGGTLGLAALSFFTALLAYYAARYAGENSFEFQVQRLNQRILWPWMGWSLIYIVAKLIDAHLSGRRYSSELESYMWWTGPSLHLWYLPFAFTVSLAITQLIAPIKVSTPLYGVLLACLVALCLSCGYGLNSGVIDKPWLQWLSVMPAVFIGIMLAAANDRPGRILSLLFAILVGGLVTHTSGFYALAMQLAVGGLAAILAVQWNPGSNRLTFWLGAISLGIYLAHPLCSSIVRVVTGQEGTWAAFAMTVAASIILAEAYRRVENLIRDLSHRKEAVAVIENES